MGRGLALLYGTVCYLVFFGTFLYLVWFLWTIDQPQAAAPLGQALAVNGGFLVLFGIQHSVMARQGFKRAWTKIIPRPVERSTYVLITSLILLGMIRFWQPMPSVIWQVDNPTVQMLLRGLFIAGILLVLVATFLIDHFELFGLKQVWLYFRGQSFQPPTFRTPGPYKFLRHPLYLGWLIAFWSTPRMTAGHLLFSVMTTAYILIAIQFEERDLVDFHGEPYRVYRSGVSMLMPWPSKRKTS